MSQEIKTISREAGDTAKGYTLQKLRTISLLLDELTKDQEVDFVAAIEFNGDVFVENKHFSYIEENKAYDSQNFSFASQPIKNTIVYFIDHWLSNERNAKIKFGIYATNNVAKEIKKGRVKDLAIDLPESKIIESLDKKDYSDPNTIEAVKTLIVDEYKSQYENNKNVSLENSYYAALLKFENQDWIDFLNTISWIFTDEKLETLEGAIIDKINSGPFITSDKIHLRSPFIRAELFYQLELRQGKQKTAERFLTRKDVEIVFYKAVYEGIEEESYKYLTLDYTEIEQKTKSYLRDFIDLKYFAISGLKNSPCLLNRDVLLFDENRRLASHQANSEQIRPDSIQGSFSGFVQSRKPIFLFGDLGSGKSSIVAQYLLEVIGQESGIVPLFIPSSYLHQRNLSALENVKSAINDFVNNELQLVNKSFDLDTVFKTGKEIVLVIDGLDELEIRVARQLIVHLKSLKSASEFLRIIATGRPVELEGLVPSGWHVLCTIALTEKEILSVLYNEAKNRKLSDAAAKRDSEQRFMFLQGRPELYAIADTPLIICSIRNSLNEGIGDKTLGDILYETLQQKLNWDSLDSRADDFSDFNIEFPSVFNKEPLLASLAWKIFTSKAKALSETELHSAVNSMIGAVANKPRIVTQAIKYFKNIFLQETTNRMYGFISAPLLECASGLFLAENLKSDHIEIDSKEHWRSLSFALAIARIKGESSSVAEETGKLICKNLTWPNNFVAQGAIILAEFKHEVLCDEYFEILNQLQFRPLHVQNQNDTVSLHSYATCIKISKTKGYKWFWDNYLSPKHPLKSYQVGLAAKILTQYLLLQNFELDQEQSKQLEDLILPNLALPSNFCYELLPIIATVTGNSFLPKQRYQLLAGCLSKKGLKEKAKEILSNESLSFRKEVLEALETICALREDREIEPAALWFELKQGKQINKAVLNTILLGTSPDLFAAHTELLVQYITETDLSAFLKYCVLSGNELGNKAALFLFLQGEKDFKLIGSPLINSVDWLDYKSYEVVDKIHDFVFSQDASTILSIVNNIPVQNHLGIPPAYWKVFLSVLESSDEIFEKQFLTALKHLSLHIITRFPEIRIAFSSLLKSRIGYLEIARSAMLDLNHRLRYSSAALLVTLNPQTEYDALAIVVSGMASSSEMDEWQTFCLGIHYGTTVLDKLHENIDYFSGVSKVYSLLILQRNGRTLEAGERKELTNGLLGEGYFIDRTGHGFNSRYHVTLSQPEFKDEIISFLRSPDLDKAKRAADLLLQYHFEGVENSLKPKIYLLHAESFDLIFFEFTQKFDTLFPDAAIISQLKYDAEVYEKEQGQLPLLWLFYQVIKEAQPFEILLKTLIQKSGLRPSHEMATIYEWLLNLRRLYPDLEKSIGSAVQQILSIPVLSESSGDNFAWLKLMEDEFSEDPAQENAILQEMNPHRDEELFVSLHFREVYKKELTSLNYRQPVYYSVFAQKSTSFIEEVDEIELEKLLFDMEQIPESFSFKIENILLFGNYTTDRLNEIEKQGNLASYLATVIKFCRGEQVSVELFAKSNEIGGIGISNRVLTEFHLSILRKIYQILISEDQYKKAFMEGLLQKMEDENESNFMKHFSQLLALGHSFTKEQVFRFFDELHSVPYMLKHDLAFQLSVYLSEQIPESEVAQYVHKLHTILFSNANQFNRSDDPQRLLLSWILSLALLFLEDKVTDDAKFGFLIGLQSCFLENNSLARSLINKPDYFFLGGDVLKITYPLLEKVRKEHISEIVKYGANTNIPEIRATCYLLSAIRN
ncbi:hypothetical protein AR687_24205 [Flavobacteriaceae bacterium CRH]|nr:hypothetical protein AR687_24205 [Flavobacteriaceae bacterium CRH]